MFRLFVESDGSTKKRNISPPSSSIPVSGIEPQTIVIRSRHQNHAGSLAMASSSDRLSCWASWAT